MPDTNNLETTASQATGADTTIAILDFWAEWCGICRLIDPVLKRISSHHGNVVLKKINVAEEKELVSKHKVMTLPTLVFVSSDGRELERMSGTMTGKQIEATLSLALGKLA